MNIGFVTTWFERGAAYVSKAYASLLEENNIFIYARGGYSPRTKTNKSWNSDNVTYGYKMNETSISKRHFLRWIKKNKLDIVFFNEQMEVCPPAYIKLFYPKIKIGTYIDYYKQNSIKQFSIYDFLICNTKRHYSVFSWHPQAYYVPWGTDTELFNPDLRVSSDEVRFFHSAGMSLRKGTDILINCFVSSDLHNKSKLIIHTQIPIRNFTDLSVDELKKYNIEVIEKTVTAPGLYHLGDVYVYPTTLDGLGLTMYEALSEGMPVITTNCAPMNEIVNGNYGRLVNVEKTIARSDGYYWPLSLVDKQSLITEMEYYVNNVQLLKDQQIMIRKQAEKDFNWLDRKDDIIRIFTDSKILQHNKEEILEMINKEKKHQWGRFYSGIVGIMPGIIQDFMHEKIH